MATKRVWPSVVDVLINKDNIQRLSNQDRFEVVDTEVRRNLERLLNTRLPPGSFSEYLTEVSGSVQHSGVLDFARYGFDTYKQRRALCSSIRRVIESSEPRLDSIIVEDKNTVENLDRQLHFRISGELMVYPHPRRIVYESRMDRATTLFTVHD